MIGAWIFSVVLTIAIVMITSNSEFGCHHGGEGEGHGGHRRRDFFGNPARGELRPYERLLREARQARARNDFKAERQYYKQVLDLLHTEAPGSSGTQAVRNRLAKGITGSRDHDRELEKLILTV